MAWNYDVTKLLIQQIPQVRFLIGDTNANDQQLQDEEIQFSLNIRSSVWGAAATCCESISANLSRKADTTTGELRTLYSSLSRAYHARAGSYEQKASELGGGMPFAGGISVLQKQMAELDPDRVDPIFNRGLTDNLNYPIGPVGNEPSVPTPNVGSV